MRYTPDPHIRVRPKPRKTSGKPLEVRVAEALAALGVYGKPKERKE